MPTQHSMPRKVQTIWTTSESDARLLTLSSDQRIHVDACSVNPKEAAELIEALKDALQLQAAAGGAQD